jgi:hypothetical protein
MSDEANPFEYIQVPRFNVALPPGWRDYPPNIQEAIVAQAVLDATKYAEQQVRSAIARKAMDKAGGAT